MTLLEAVCGASYLWYPGVTLAVGIFGVKAGLNPNFYTQVYRSSPLTGVFWAALQQFIIPHYN